MPAKCVGICKIHIKLNCPRKRLKRLFMLFLQWVAVSKNTPSFRSQQWSLECIIADIGQVNLFLQMPKTSGIVLKTLKSVRFKLKHFLVHLLSLCPLRHFKVASRNLAKDPACCLLFLWKTFELRYRIRAFEITHQLVSDSNISEKCDKVMLLGLLLTLHRSLLDLKEMCTNLLTCRYLPTRRTLNIA